MRSLFKLSIASLAAFALFVSVAFAQAQRTAPVGTDPGAQVGMEMLHLAVNLDLMGSLGQLSTSSEKDTALAVTDSAAAATATAAAVSASPAKTTTTANAGFTSQWQADVNLNAKMGDAGGRFKLRFRDTSGANPDTDRSELWYNFGAVQLKMHIRSWGLPASTIAYSAYTGTTTTTGFPTDVAGPVAFWVNQSGLDVSAKFGAMNAGLAIFDSCVPACGYNPAGLSTLTTTTGVLGAGTAVITPAAGGTSVAATNANIAGSAGSGGNSAGSKATQSIVPYFYGTFGPATVGVFLASTSGSAPSVKVSGAKTQDNDQSVTGSLFDINGKVAFGPVTLALEIANWSSTCAKKALSTVGGAGGATGTTATTQGQHGNDIDVTNCSPQTQALTVLGTRVNAGPGRVEFHYATFALDNKVEFTTFGYAGGTAGGAAASTRSTSTPSEVSFHQGYTDIMLGYAIPMNPSYWLVPVYTSRTTTEEQKIKTGDRTTLATAAVTTAKTDRSGKLEQTVNVNIIAISARGIF